MAGEPVSRSERSTEQAVSSGPPAPPALAPQPAPPRSNTSTFLDASSVFEGVIHSGEPLRLDGRVKGEIHCKDTVVIGESARIEATIRAEVVAVAGEVRGEVHASRKITLGATARMVGDLTTPAIAIEEGAELVGRAQIGAALPKSATPAVDSRRDTRPAKASTPPPPPTA
jgi:cytoskeletal protein CcmA (bactofilin family)